MIAITDFSERGLKQFNEAKESKSFSDAWDFVQYLINNDYPINEVKEFSRKEFKQHYKHLCFEVLS